MTEFLKFFDSLTSRYEKSKFTGQCENVKLHLEIYYSNVMDWCIRVYKKSPFGDGEEIEMVNVQHCDMELCFAKAQVELKEWLLEHEGGY